MRQKLSNFLGYLLLSTFLLSWGAKATSLFVDEQKILASDSRRWAEFGGSIALSRDGKTALIGAMLGGDVDGAAYVFVRDGSGSWSEQQKLIASDQYPEDYFGVSVALSGDGNTALIGAYKKDVGSKYGGATYVRDAGTAYVFVRDADGHWSQQRELVASDRDRYDRPHFGRSVALSENGNTALVGAYWKDVGSHKNAGAAYVFVRDSSGIWSEQQKLTASDAIANSWFGVSSALSGDGNTALIGTHSFGDSSYVFVRDGSGIWSEQQKLTPSDVAADDRSGWSVALSKYANTALIGVPGEYAAYVFVQEGSGIWSEQQKLTASDGVAHGLFGSSVALSGDGNTALIGAYKDVSNGDIGAAYVFVREGSGFWSEGQKLIGSGEGFHFGKSVSLSGNGKTALIGDPAENFQTGTTYAYVRSSPCTNNGLSISVAPWQMIGIPCKTNTPTVKGIFTAPTNTTPLNQEDYGIRWVLYQRNTSNNAYVQLGLNDPIELGRGYWLQSLDAAQIDFRGTETPRTKGIGCFSAEGCYRIPLMSTRYASARWNLVGYPFPFPVGWDQVRVVVDDAQVYTPSQAESNQILSKNYWVWKDNTYYTYDDATPGMFGTLNTYEGIWVKVLAEGTDHIELLIPAVTSTPSTVQASQKVAVAAVAQTGRQQAGLHTDQGEWYVRLIVEDPKAGLQDQNAVLGQLQDSQSGYDLHDLWKMPPFSVPYLDLWEMPLFSPPYLTLVFPHSDWGDRAGDYASDYRGVDEQADGDTWTFEVRSDTPQRSLVLRWEGPMEILQRSVLIDLLTGEEIPAMRGTYAFELYEQSRAFRWAYRIPRFGNSSPGTGTKWW